MPGTRGTTSTGKCGAVGGGGGTPRGPPGVPAPLSPFGLGNFSIFKKGVFGRHLLFLYGEYEGDDFDGDMARLSAEERDVAWHLQCDPMQLSLNESGAGWAPMECVYYNA